MNNYLNPMIFGNETEMVPTRNGYGEGLLELGEKNTKVVVLTGDLAESTRVLEFAKKYPQRFIECGVAEQNMTGIAAGLAAAGKIPFVSSYAVFAPGRSWDQTRVSVAYSNLNVKIAGAHTGVSVGPDGATHQALEDIAIMRVLQNMTVVAPCDALETPFEIGKATIFWDSTDKKKQVAIIGCGPLLYECLIAAKELQEEGIGSMVINNHTIKPMDEKTIIRAATECGAVVTVEEHQVMGGMGSAVAELLARSHPVPLEFVGMPDTFGESGEPKELLVKYGMDVKAIKEAVYKVIKRK